MNNITQDGGGTRLFLSHAGADSRDARMLADRLRSQGFDVWVDCKDLEPNRSWLEQIEQAIESSDVFVVYVTDHGIQNWVDAELRAALVHNRRDKHFCLIPLLGPGHDKDRLPLFLRSETSWVEIDRWPGDADLSALVDKLRGTESLSVQVLEKDESPYPGLYPFDQNNAHLFFGRDQDVEKLLRKVEQDRFLTVIGGSGSGKSSILRAGLIPALRRGRFRDPVSGHLVNDWRIAVFNPGDAPFRNAARAILALDREEAATFYGQGKQDVAEDRICQRIALDTEALADVLLRLIGDDIGPRVLLIVDQFEEVFRHVDDPIDRKRFIDGLLRSADVKGKHSIHVLIHLRSDFLGACDSHSQLAERVAGNLFWCTRMTTEKLREAIVRPLQLAGWTPAPGLVDTLVRDVGEEPGNLALLAFALEQLWENRYAIDGPERRVDRLLPFAIYNQRDGLAGMLRERADTLFDALFPMQQQGGTRQEDEQIVRQLFMQVSQGGGGEPITRRRIRRRELLDRFKNRRRASELLDRLIESRLLVSEEDPKDPGSAPVTAIHEALLRGWPKIEGWLKEDRERISAEESLAKAASDWKTRDAEGRGSDYLWSGARIDATLELANLGVVPLKVQRFADACRSEEQHRAARDRAFRDKIDLLSKLTDLDRVEAEERELYPAWPKHAARIKKWIVERAEPIARILSQLEEEMAETQSRATVSADGEDDIVMPNFNSHEDAYLYGRLRDGVERVAAFHNITLERSRERLRWAQIVQSISIDAYRERWRKARDAIWAADGANASERYGKHRLDLAPQMGLVPIGMNPLTKLWEFYHLRSGWDPLSSINPAEIPIPLHRDDGSISVSGDTGIVFVLVPGDTFTMGAQKENPDAPNYDPMAEECEVPHEVTLEPYFISRFTATQGQWSRLSGGDNLSKYQPGGPNYGADEVTMAHPAENADWLTCNDLVTQHGLSLPTEAQWEYACRAGTTTPWWTGQERETLIGAVNLADGTAAQSGATWDSIKDWPDLEDGFVIHAPVDALRPNPWGLHNVHGNVLEWCQDWYGSYEKHSRREGDGLLLVPEEEARGLRVSRGGSFYYPAARARSSFRGYYAATYRRSILGLRPARVCG